MFNPANSWIFKQEPYPLSTPHFTSGGAVPVVVAAIAGSCKSYYSLQLEILISVIMIQVISYFEKIWKLLKGKNPDFSRKIPNTQTMSEKHRSSEKNPGVVTLLLLLLPVRADGSVVVRRHQLPHDVVAPYVRASF